jgi:hypothetical protein
MGEDIQTQGTLQKSYADPATKDLATAYKKRSEVWKLIAGLLGNQQYKKEDLGGWNRYMSLLMGTQSDISKTIEGFGIFRQTLGWFWLREPQTPRALALRALPFGLYRGLCQAILALQTSCALWG